MSELATLGPTMLSEVLTGAPEAVRLVIYDQGMTRKTGIHAIPDKLRYGETDNEAIKSTDTAWMIFAHELALTPSPDDVITTEDSREHYVVYATAEDPAGILWRVITRG